MGLDYFLTSVSVEQNSKQFIMKPILEQFKNNYQVSNLFTPFV